MNRLLVVSVGCVVLFACPGPQVDCRVGADCASGVCLRDGTCGPVEEVDGGTGGGTGGGSGGGTATGGGTGGGSVGGGGGTTSGGGTGGGSGGGNVSGGGAGGGMVGCLPNNDGRIDRGEVFFQPGLRATFKISGPATFDTAGTMAADGGRQWDFTPALAGDSSRLVETKPLTGAWYESSYPDAGYVSELGQGSDLLGVFAATPTALYLQGVVSPADGTSSTKIFYTPWVKVLQFPLQAGGSWGTTSTVSGKYQGFTIGNAAFGTGLPFQEETYTSNVDRAGDALTPFSNFAALRVRTVMVRSTRVYTLNPWTPILTLRSFNWNTECFGTVATLTSTDNESSTEFTSAAEVRRLSP
jgi:hypothetical protein